MKLIISNKHKKRKINDTLIIKGGLIRSKLYLIRQKTIEEEMEELGLSEEMEDQPSSYIRDLEKNTLTEEEFGAISQKIERRLENYINKISNKHRECEEIIGVVEDLIFSVDDWTYFYQDDEIVKVAEKYEKEMKDLQNKIVDILVDKDIDDEEQFLHYLYKLETKIEEDGDKTDYFEERYKKLPKVLGDTYVNIYDILFEAEEYLNRYPKNQKILKKHFPILYYGMKLDKALETANKIIKDLLISKGYATKCKAIPKVELSDYPIVTPKNPDLSYASNPFIKEYYSDDLKNRIEKAKKKVKFKF